MAESSSLILRINGTAGRCRMEVESRETLEQLKQKVAEKFQIPVREIAFRRNGSTLAGDAKSLHKLGLQSGETLQLFSMTQQSLDASSATKLTPTLAETTVGPEMRKSSSAVSLGTRSAGSSPGKKGKRDKNFQPFETFLETTTFDTATLPLNQSFCPVEKKSGGATQLPPTITLKHQSYRHVDHLEIMNVKEVSEFVGFWRYEGEMLQQRAAYLIGYYREDPHYEKTGIRAVVEAIYEPQQMSAIDDVVVTPDDELLPVVEQVAHALGLEIVGLVFTHLPRDKLIAAPEALRMAQHQLRYLHHSKHYTGYPITTFVTMTISVKSDGEPSPDAFMVSDLGLALVRDGLLSAVNDRDVQIRQPNKNEMMPTVLEQGKSVKQFDADWLIVRVNESAPREIRSIFKRCDFPRLGRKNPTLSDVAAFMKSAPKSSSRPWEKYADFHFLIFVALNFGVESATSVCQAIRTKQAIDANFEEILTSLS